jgi:hypothetical protein
VLIAIDEKKDDPMPCLVVVFRCCFQLEVNETAEHDIAWLNRCITYLEQASRLKSVVKRVSAIEEIDWIISSSWNFSIQHVLCLTDIDLTFALRCLRVVADCIELLPDEGQSRHKLTMLKSSCFIMFESSLILKAADSVREHRGTRQRNSRRDC